MELSGDKGCVQKHSSTICYYITLKPVCYLFPYMCLGVPPNQGISNVQNKLLQRCIKTSKRTVLSIIFSHVIYKYQIFFLKNERNKKFQECYVKFVQLNFSNNIFMRKFILWKTRHRYLQRLTCKILFMLLYEFP